MQEYIFYTTEGYCQAPDNSEVENFQLLGFVQGSTPQDAVNRLIEDNPWILEKGYNLREIHHKAVVF